MKRTVSIIMAAALLLVCLAGCAGTKTAEIAVCPDFGSKDESSFIGAIWKGAEDYAKANGKTVAQYLAANTDEASLTASIETAVANGAKLIVCTGTASATPVYVAQDKYPNVAFALVNAEPCSGGDKPIYKTGGNTRCYDFAEREAGFLAGYAAVREGYTRLGIMAGAEMTTIEEYCDGFRAGANYAAVEQRLEAPTFEYSLINTFKPSDAVKSLAAEWYKSGTQLIFVCASDATSSVTAAAEENGGQVIAVDVDQSAVSKTVLTSALLNLDEVARDALTAYYSGAYAGGQTIKLGAAEGGVSLAMDNSHFTKFTLADYGEIYAKLASGEIKAEEWGIALAARLQELMGELGGALKDAWGELSEQLKSAFE